jgi:hypothetical protein
MVVNKELKRELNKRIAVQFKVLSSDILWEELTKLTENLGQVSWSLQVVAYIRRLLAILGLGKYSAFIPGRIKVKRSERATL